MIRFAFLLAVGLCLNAGSAAPGAQSGSPKIFVASTGNDANDGGRATPNRSFQAAHDAVAASGEIVVLDTAGYGPVTITKSIGIVVPQGVNGFVTVTSAGAYGITINAGSSDIVTLRGLIIEGTGLNSGRGISGQSLRTLVVEDTVVRNFALGIYLKSPGNPQLVVRGGAVRNTQFGIDVEDAGGGGSVTAYATDVEMTANKNSFYVGQTFSGSTVALIVKRCNVMVSGTESYVFRAFYRFASIVVDDCLVTGTGFPESIVFKPDGSSDNLGRIYTRGNTIVYGDLLRTQGSDPAPIPFSAD